jgi:cardiolipin synthase
MDFKKSIPNYLTYFRIAVIPLLVASFYLLKGEWGATLSAGIFLVAALTDWLDGYTARLWGAQSNVGRFLDPIADKLLVATALILLVSTGQAHALPALAILCREILVSGLREFLAEIRIGVPVSNLAKWKTAVQMTAITWLLWGVGAPDWLPVAFLGSWLLWVAAGLTLITGYVYLKTGLKHMH